MPLFRVPHEEDLRKMEVAGIITFLVIGTLMLIAGVILVFNDVTWGWGIVVSAALSELAGIGLLLCGRHRPKA